MRVLWFTNTPSGFARDMASGTFPVRSSGSRYNGGGWISSLENEIKDKVELGVAFVGRGNPSKWRVGHEGVTYFPMRDSFTGRLGRMFKLLFGNYREEKQILSQCIRVAADFKPDIIEVFGTERVFGLVVKYTSVPVVVHLQGILGEYLKTYFPKGVSAAGYFAASSSAAQALARVYRYIDFRRRAKIEARIMRCVRYYAGRTAWDKACVLAANPQAQYFHVDEILRSEFYRNAGKWNPPQAKEVEIVSVISEAPYKGFDMVLRTAAILKSRGLTFTWKVYGNVDASVYEKLTGISPDDVGVRLCGVADASSLCKALSESTVYAHPSLADNSPNSVCEAQMTGIPIVAFAIGGIPTLLDGDGSSVLVNSLTASAFADALTSVIEAVRCGCVSTGKALAIAKARHDRCRIVESLLETYKTIALESVLK